jgi:hypothetical protein
MRLEDPAKLAQVRRGATPPLHVIESFMLALTSANDGEQRKLLKDMFIGIYNYT